MRYLVLVRHGDYGTDGRLSTSGREQMFRLSPLLKERIETEWVHIFSSSAPRAMDSATILSEAFKVSFAAAEMWWSDDQHDYHPERALAFVREHGPSTDALMVVTHLEYTEEFPGYFARAELGVELPFMSVEKGDALVIDCEAKTIALIGRDTKRKTR